MRILLVEGNEGLRSAFRKALEEAGYSTAGAGTWAEAVEAARRERPGLLLVDASHEPLAAAEFVRVVRRDARLRELPIAGIASLPGSERGILDAGVQCCIRAFPAPADLVKVARWAASVYRDAAA